MTLCPPPLHARPVDPDRFARETLRLLGPAPDNWVLGRPGVEYNVAIVGGGQNGSAFAFALQRAGIGRVTVILCWRDRFELPADQRDDELGGSPYLGEGLEYLEKTPGAAPWLRDIHLYNPGGFVSAGLPLGDVPSMRREIPAVVAHISRDLALADLELHEQRIRVEVAPDFDEDLYAAALWKPAPPRQPSKKAES
ncbi:MULTISPECIES: hypothetical protein [unclassified Variovorax]|uniref:hypothetical protein n=1 Tax=unclassified Variovorax TaxID=663243 RepID=UPI003F5154E0